MVILMINSILLAQVGIGTNSPNALLDIVSSSQSTPANNDGILIPKIDEFPLAPPTVAQDGMMVYATGSGSVAQGFYYWNNGSTSWQILSGGSGGDADWFQENTTIVPTAITDDIFTEGNVAIGKADAVYPLDIVSSTGLRGLNLVLGGTNSGTIYGSYFENSNTGGGNHFGSYTALTGASTGTQTGFNAAISNTGNATHTGTANLLSGSGVGWHLGMRNDLSGSSATGNSDGVFNNIGRGGSGIINGVRNDLTNGSSTGTKTGVRNSISGSGSTKIGVSNSIQGTATGSQAGIESIVQTSSDVIQYGTSNSVTANTGNNSNTFGTYNSVNGDGNGMHFGTYNDLASGTGTGEHFGAYNNLDTTGDNIQYGSRNILNSTGNGIQYGVRNSITTTGTGNLIGMYSFLANTGTAPKYGVVNQLQGTSSGEVYGLYNDVNSASTSVKYGVYNDFQTSGAGTTGGSLIGMYTDFNQGAGNTAVDAYGMQTIIGSNVTGVGYGIYVQAPDPTHYAGYLIGNLYMSSGRATFVTNTDATPSTGSGVLEIGGNLRIDNNEIITNTGNTLFLQNDNDGDLRVDNNSFMVDASTNRVGIGTLTPGYALDVIGDINTSGNIRQSGGAYSFPDYVFESYFDGFSPYKPEYQLRSLEEIEQFLIDHKHLPGVQSREDVAKNGWNLTEGVRTNLEKVEELYLYALELKDKCDGLEKENKELSTRLDRLESLIEKLIN